MSSSPSLLVSKASKLASKRAGTSRNCRFGSPQFCRKSFTDLSEDTLCTISFFVSVPELSLSIIWKTWRAIDKNSALNSSSSAAAARAARARSSDICCRRFARPRLIASSPVRTSKSEPGVLGDDAAVTLIG